MKIINKLRESLIARDMRGLTTVEYIIILCVVACIAIGSWQMFGSAVTNKVNQAKTRVDNLDPG